MIDKIGVNSVNHIKASKPEATKPAFKGQEELPQIEELRGSVASTLTETAPAFLKTSYS